MLTISKEFLFDAAHKLRLNKLSDDENREVYGKCCQLHGHTYKLQITVSGPAGPEGMVINFTKLKAIVKELVVERYDHAYLNDLDEYRNIPSTAENMSTEIFKLLDGEFQGYGIRLESVVLYETPTSWATVTRDA